MVEEAYGHHWSSANKGANILVDLAISEEYKEKSGQYFDNDEGKEKGFFSPAHYDSLVADKIEDLFSFQIL